MTKRKFGQPGADQKARLIAAAETETFVDLSHLSGDEYRDRLRALKADAGMVRVRDAVKPILDVVTLDFIEGLAAIKYCPPVPYVLKRSAFDEPDMLLNNAIADAIHPHCSICRRKLVHHTETTPDDPAMDCGGDCWGCIEEIEAWCRDNS